MKIGYARVSTLEQDPALQHDALNKAGCEKIFTDCITGSTDSRPEFDKLVEQLRVGDTLVVWKLDRLGRSIKHLIELTGHFEQLGVGFVSLSEAIDTTTPAGRLLFHMMAALAEFERDLIKERTNAGLAAARKRGRTGGRPPKMTANQIASARKLAETGELTKQEIADTFNISRTTLYHHLRVDSE